MINFHSHSSKTVHFSHVSRFLLLLHGTINNKLPPFHSNFWCTTASIHAVNLHFINVCFLCLLGALLGQNHNTVFRACPYPRTPTSRNLPDSKTSNGSRNTHRHRIMIFSQQLIRFTIRSAHFINDTSVPCPIFSAY